MASEQDHQSDGYCRWPTGQPVEVRLRQHQGGHPDTKRGDRGADRQGHDAANELLEESAHRDQPDEQGLEVENQVSKQIVNRAFAPA